MGSCGDCGRLASGRDCRVVEKSAVPLDREPFSVCSWRAHGCSRRSWDVAPMGNRAAGGVRCGFYESAQHPRGGGCRRTALFDRRRIAKWRTGVAHEASTEAEYVEIRQTGTGWKGLLSMSYGSVYVWTPDKREPLGGRIEKVIVPLPDLTDQGKPRLSGRLVCVRNG